MGVPAIVSDLPVFREIGGDFPTYLSATDRQGWEAAILDYSKPESAARRSQLERLEGFKAPTWQRHFDVVEKWLSSLS